MGKKFINDNGKNTTNKGPVVRLDLHNHTFDYSGASKFLKKDIEAIYTTKILYPSLNAVAITNYHNVSNALVLKDKFPSYIIVGCEYRVVEKNFPMHVVCLNISDKHHRKLMSARLRGIEYFISFLKNEKIIHYLTRVAWGIPINQKVIEHLYKYFKKFYAIDVANISIERESLFAKKLASYYELAKVGGSDNLISYYKQKVYTEFSETTLEKALDSIQDSQTVIGTLYTPETKQHKSWWYIGKEIYQQHLHNAANAHRFSSKIGDLDATFENKYFFEIISQSQHIYKLEKHEKKIEKLEKVFTDYLRWKKTQEIFSSDSSVEEKKETWVKCLKNINSSFEL
ncbi:hypothetical protein [Candidatus Uabimicrobium sp. HlEnr_7]|uniref:hypothetical protein n=1 Tax=Candidatus Uabimicrobium helgolandensis TaxID=3095367 RepID=UPI0035591127